MSSSPVEAAGASGPVDVVTELLAENRRLVGELRRGGSRPVEAAGARGADEIAPSIDTYGGDETRGARSAQHWRLRFGALFVADSSVPEHVAVWQAVIDERSRLLAEVERLRRVADLAARVMATLAEYGPGIVGHLLDTDENDGERLRAALAASLPVPTEDER